MRLMYYRFDQLKNGIVSKAVRNKISVISEKIPIIVDSQNRIHLYCNAILKPNHIEAVSSVYPNAEINNIDYNMISNAASQLYEKLRNL